VKRLIIPGAVLLAMGALAYWGNSLLARTLDAKLPGLLSSELGIAVTLQPTRASIATLTVHTPRLVMGNPDDPALVATDVMVSLNWSDLLHGEIRLRRASGASLQVTPSRWPGNDDPWPTDYRFLDPYLPDLITLDSGRYVDASGAALAVSAARWQRQDDGMLLTWQQAVKGRGLAVTARLLSLEELLRLARLRLNLSTEADGDKDSLVSAGIDLQPGTTTGYTLDVDLLAAGMQARVESRNTTAWEFPAESTTRIAQLRIDALRALIGRYAGGRNRQDQRAAEGTEDAAAADLLDRTLPRLSLPLHRGKLVIDEIHWQDEVTLDNTVEFQTGPQGVAFPAISLEGAGGNLLGKANLASDDSGWQLDANASITATDGSKGLAAAYLESDWLWHTGSAVLAGRGDRWGNLLNSLEGQVTLAGSHRGATRTPVSVSARLDNRPGEFALDEVTISVGNGTISGSASLSGDQRRKITGRLKADRLNLDFLIPAEEAAGGPAEPYGLPVPEFLGGLPGIDLDFQLAVQDLTVGRITLRAGTASLERSADKLALVTNATGTSGGTVDLDLDAKLHPELPAEVALQAVFSQFNLPALFRQQTSLIDSRTSGTLSLRSRGRGVEAIFEALEGHAAMQFDLRPDRNWQRDPDEQEQVNVIGDATLVIQQHRITGLKIENLAVDSLRQNLTGTLSMVDGRTPYFIADLSSTALNLDKLGEFQELAASGSGQDTSSSEAFSLKSLRALSATQIRLEADSLTLKTLPLSGVTIQLTTGSSGVSVDQLDFSLDQGTVTSKAALEWQKNTARLSLDAQLGNMVLDRFLGELPGARSVPVSGTASLASAGASWQELLAHLTGQIQLKAAAGSAESNPFADAAVSLTASRTEDGMRADIHQLRWQGSQLAGSLQYHESSPPLFEARISGGELSLLPWEKSAEEKKAAVPDKAAGESAISRTARASADVIGDVVMAPYRLIAGPREAEPGEKLFSPTPFELDWLAKYQVRIEGRLDRLTSQLAEAENLTLSASILKGDLNIEASAEAFNSGSASLSLAMDVSQVPTPIHLQGTFRNVHGPLIKASFPRSGYVDIHSAGSSQAELAAHANGMVYLELGAGPLDYRRLMFLTADVASSAFETLIPGVDKQQQQLECGVTLGLFKDGLATTPYGYAARTRQANLVGRLDLDLKKELIHLNFSSSSRQGVGLSVGNVFSNTVEIEGPLTDPRIIPNATGLLWRSWAAIVTGGLSVVGESVLKRALASENPCESVQKHIRKGFCGTPEAHGAPPMVCPTS